MFVGSEDVSIELLRAGLAWHFRAHSSDALLAREETEARAARRGLWADKDPVPAWDWRRREHATEGGGSPVAAALAPRGLLRDFERAVGDEPVRGPEVHAS